MTSYCTITDVSNELNGLTIDSSSVPSSATVSTWIEQESSYLDQETGRIWGSATYTNEYYDYDGSGYIRLNHAPILAITSASYEANGLSGTSENWIGLSEGRLSSADYIAYKDEGELHFHNSSIIAGYQNFKITYIAGYASIPSYINMIVAKRVSLRMIETIANDSSSEVGGSISVGAISISDPSTFSTDRVKQLKNDIRELLPNIGKFKTFRYNRRWV